jgi:Fe-S cluster biogenesis protein NfuA
MQERDIELGLDVQRVLQSRVRPLLNIDAGDCEILSVEDGHVTIGFLGSCSRCIFRASCASYTVLDLLEEHFADRDATFSVAGLRIPRDKARLLGPAHPLVPEGATA